MNRKIKEVERERKRLQEIEQSIINNKDMKIRAKIKDWMDEHYINFEDLVEIIKHYYEEKGIVYKISQSHMRSIICRPRIMPRVQEALIAISNGKFKEEDFV